jgi:cytosine permease
MANLPSYLAAAKPVPWTSRAPWYKTITPTYAGVMLWFVFWQELVKGNGAPAGVIAQGIGPAFLGLIIGAVTCHFFFYMAPAMLGVRTGLPLYVVGTSTYGVRGGLVMPGFLMGLLQFGWLGVNAFAVAGILCKCFNVGLTEAGVAEVPGAAHATIAIIFVLAAAVVGMKGIQYVAGIATYLPLIPVAILIILLANTWGGLSKFHLGLVCAEGINPAAEGMQKWDVISFLTTYIVGFFATAGAAGVDIASNARNEDDVHIGGLTGVVLPTVLAGEATILIVAGAYGLDMVSGAHAGNLNPVDLMSDIMGTKFGNIAMIGLAISSFPGACFSSLIAANSFKTVMPKINPTLSVGAGALVSALLAVSGLAGKVIPAFQVIGASFGPICGAMLADFLLSGRRWSGPRAGFNAAGWISWFFGLIVGAFNLVVDLLLQTSLAETMPGLADWQNYVPVPPVAAMVVGFVLYMVLSLMGARSKLVDLSN